MRDSVLFENKPSIRLSSMKNNLYGIHSEPCTLPIYSGVTDEDLHDELCRSLWDNVGGKPFEQRQDKLDNSATTSPPITPVYTVAGLCKRTHTTAYNNIF